MLFGIAPEATKNQARLVERTGLGFPLLADEGSAVVRSYGVLNEEQGTVPHPSIFVIDRDGVVRHVHVDPNYAVRPPASDVLGWVPSATRETAAEAPPGE